MFIGDFLSDLLLNWSFSQVLVVAEDTVLVLTRLEAEEAFDTQHLVLLEHIEVLPHDIGEDLTQLGLHALNLSLSCRLWTAQVDALHEVIIDMALIHHLLEDEEVLELEEDPGGSHLIHDALEEGNDSLKQQWVLVVVLVLHNLQVLANDGVVYED